MSPNKPTLEKALLILDLDETLIHACISGKDRPSDLDIFDYFVYKRPFLDDFLKEMFKYYNVAIWSTGSDDYVEKIVKAITPVGCQFDFIWGRSRCTARNLEMKIGGRINISGVDYVKPLAKVKRIGYKLERILIVDDSPYKCADNYGNAIYIKAFEGDLNDCELPKLAKYLKQMQPKPDYRKIEKRGWENGSH